MVLFTPKPSRRRPSTAPGSSVHTTTPTSSLDPDSSPGATSGSSASSLDSPELDFAAFLASAPQPGELKIFGESDGARKTENKKSAFRPRPLSFFGSSTSTSTSSSSLSTSTSSGASRRFSFPRSLSTSVSSTSSSDPQPHVAATSHGTGFVRTTTTSGGICYVAEEVDDSTAVVATTSIEKVTTASRQADVKIEQVEPEQKSLSIVRAPSRIASHTQLWTPPNRAPPPTPPKSSRRQTLSLENALNTLTLTRRPAPTRLSILNNPPAVLRDLECPPSAWKSSPSSPHSPATPGSKGRGGRRAKRGDPNVEAAVDWLRARKGTYGGVLRRLKIAVDPDAEGREVEGWVVCESLGGSDGNGSAKKGGKVLGQKGKGKGKKVQLSKTGGAGEKVGWLGREIGGKAPFFLV